MTYKYQAEILAAREHPRRTSKTCSVCHRTLPLDSFHLGGSTIDGRAAACKDCANKRTRKWNRVEKPVSVSEKWCPGCQQWLTASAFHRDKVNLTGLQTWCKSCRKRYSDEGQLPKHDRTRIVQSYRGSS